MQKPMSRAGAIRPGAGVPNASTITMYQQHVVAGPGLGDIGSGSKDGTTVDCYRLHVK